MTESHEKLKVNAIIGSTGSECEVISALVSNDNQTEMVYVAKLDTHARGSAIEYLWYLPGQVSLKADVSSAHTIPSDELPCTLQMLNGLRTFGYEWRGMLPIDKRLAIDLYRQGTVVYVLQADGSEYEVVQESEIVEDLVCVMYGVTVEDWLITCGRLRDGEVVSYDSAHEPFQDVFVPGGRYRGVTVAAGEEIEGFLLVCNGQINRGKAYICPNVTYASMDECRDTSGKYQYAFGPFIEVVSDMVTPAGLEGEELMAYRRTGLKPSEIQEAVDLFKDTNLSVPKEIKGWVARAAFHNRKCAELTKEVERLQAENTALRVREAKTLKEQLIDRLAHENAEEINKVFAEAADEDAVKNVAVSASGHLALCNAIVAVFMEADLQYLQCAALARIPEKQSILSRILKELRKKGKVIYGEGEIKDAIFDYVHEIM